jgi:hypothetical protein
MYYTASLKSNKIYYYKETKKEKKRISEKEYNQYFIKKYQNKQSGGYKTISPKLENLSGKIYENNLLKSIKLDKNFQNLMANPMNDMKLTNSVPVDTMFVNYYTPAVRYGAYGYKLDTETNDWKQVNLGVFPVLSLAEKKVKEYVNKICEHQSENNGKMGIILSKLAGDSMNGFLDIDYCSQYKNGKYYVANEKRKGLVMSLSKTDKGWLNQDVVYEYFGNKI